MSNVVVAVPPGEVISLDAVKKHLNVDHGDDDEYIGGLALAAINWIDGPAGGWLGRALGWQTLELRTGGFRPDWCGGIKLPFPPVANVVSVKYDDAAGAEQTVDPVLYAFDPTIGLYAVPGSSWPVASCRPGSVRIRYLAGYETLPAPIRHAALMLVAHWYANREAVTDKPAGALPFAVEALLSPFRIWS